MQLNLRLAALYPNNPLSYPNTTLPSGSTSFPASLSQVLVGVLVFCVAYQVVPVNERLDALLDCLQ